MPQCAWQALAPVGASAAVSLLVAAGPAVTADKEVAANLRRLSRYGKSEQSKSSHSNGFGHFEFSVD
jgi:hypothetical protein